MLPSHKYFLCMISEENSLPKVTGRKATCFLVADVRNDVTVCRGIVCLVQSRHAHCLDKLDKRIKSIKFCFAHAAKCGQALMFIAFRFF